MGIRLIVHSRNYGALGQLGIDSVSVDLPTGTCGAVFNCITGDVVCDDQCNCGCSDPSVGPLQPCPPGWNKVMIRGVRTCVPGGTSTNFPVPNGSQPDKTQPTTTGAGTTASGGNEPWMIFGFEAKWVLLAAAVAGIGGMYFLSGGDTAAGGTKRR